jgi:peptidoglycan-N-acetylglucosamine deacetylase
MTSGRRRLRDAGLGLLFTLAIAVAGWQLSRATTFQVFGGIHARVDTSRPLVAITFDDGPSVKNT